MSVEGFVRDGRGAECGEGVDGVQSVGPIPERGSGRRRVREGRAGIG